MKKILIIILILILPIVALAAALFSDGFESGDISAWDASDTDGGKLSVTEAAKLHGNYGMACFIDDEDNKYVQDNTPSAETRYRCRFYLDYNSITLSDTKTIRLIWAWTGAWADVFFVILLKDGADYKLYIQDQADGTPVWSTPEVISDVPHCIEIDWQASSGVGQDDGSFSLWIDGNLVEIISNIDNDTFSIGFIALGTMVIGTDTSGTIYLDDFASNDDGSLIGLIGDNAIFFGTNF